MELEKAFKILEEKLENKEYSNRVIDKYCYDNLKDLFRSEAVNSGGTSIKKVQNLVVKNSQNQKIDDKNPNSMIMSTT